MVVQVSEKSLNRFKKTFSDNIFFAESIFSIGFLIVVRKGEYLRAVSIFLYSKGCFLSQKWRIRKN